MVPKQLPPKKTAEEIRTAQKQMLQANIKKLIDFNGQLMMQLHS